MPVRIKIQGLKEVKRGLQRVVNAVGRRAQGKNFRNIMRYTLNEVVSRTPGSGELRAGWDMEAKFRKKGDGWTFTGRIFNRKTATRLFYQSAISGRIKAKRKADGTPQTYGDIIPILDRGSKPHVILPRRYKYLVFRASKSPPPGSPDRSNLVVTQKVHHPGTKPYKMLSEPREKLRKLARAATVGEVEQVIKAWGRF